MQENCTAPTVITRGGVPDIPPTTPVSGAAATTFDMTKIKKLKKITEWGVGVPGR